jgi:hypothetical protein
MGEISNAADILSAVRTTIPELGVVVGYDDEMADLAIDGLAV